MNDQTVAAFAELQEAFQQCARACEQAWNAIVEAFKPIIHAVVRLYRHLYRQLCAAHLIPRQYRDTITRHKIRRYALFCARRA